MHRTLARDCRTLRGEKSQLAIIELARGNNTDKRFSRFRPLRDETESPGNHRLERDEVERRTQRRDAVVDQALQCRARRVVVHQDEVPRIQPVGAPGYLDG